MKPLIEYSGPDESGLPREIFIFGDVDSLSPVTAVIAFKVKDIIQLI